MQWGLAIVIVIGALVGAVMIPTAKRAEEARQAATWKPPAAASLELGQEYQALTRRLNIVGSALGVLVLLTILFMVVKP